MTAWWATALDSNGMTGDAWLDFWRPFFLSPVPAALAALIAAAIALLSGRWAQRKRDEAAARQEWWATARWASDHTLADDDNEAVMGFKALDALQVVDDHEITAVQARFIKSVGREMLDLAAVDLGTFRTDVGTI